MNDPVATKFCVNCVNYRHGTISWDMCVRDVKTVTIISPVHGPVETEEIGFAGHAGKERILGECGIEAKFYVEKSAPVRPSFPKSTQEPKRKWWKL
jgi:hypothetical protein